jgi:hypothetical protein
MLAALAVSGLKDDFSKALQDHPLKGSMKRWRKSKPL